MCFGVWGLAFKPGIDDLCEAFSLVIIDELLRLGAKGQAFDSVAVPKLKCLWCERAGFKLTQSPKHAGKKSIGTAGGDGMARDLQPRFAQLRIAIEQPVIIGGRNLFDSELMRDAGFDYVGVRRGKLREYSVREAAWSGRELAAA